jgi:predicted nuclease of predicted toxin-antitoxin system
VTIRLYLDEDISLRLGLLLRARGFDVVSAHDVGARGETDDEQFERANLDGRAILSFNYADFNRIAARCFDEGRVHAGILVAYRQSTRDEIGSMVDRVSVFLSAAPDDLMRNNFAVLPHTAH